MELRAYQQAAIAKAYGYLRSESGNPCIVLPTGAGKTPVIAQIVKDAVTRWAGRVMILAHRKELLSQAVDKLQAICPEVVFGVYSAGLKCRDMQQQVIVGGIQSVAKRAVEFGKFDLIIIDEAHRIPERGDGQYREFLRDAAIVNPKVRVIGLTATPYRMGFGNICTPKGILNEICYQADVRTLIHEGFLSRVVSKEGQEGIADLSEVSLVGKEYNLGEMEKAFLADGLVDQATSDIISRTENRKKILVFASGVKHAEDIRDSILSKTGEAPGLITGDTDAKVRQATIDDFVKGDLRWLVNVNVLTEGFDAPNVDCVCIVRATQSPGLYYQMAGRGLRVADNKTDCLMLDYGENIQRHGPIDAIRVKKPSKGDGEAPVKFCPECNAAAPTARRECLECGHQFPEPQLNHMAEAENAFAALSGGVKYDRWAVSRVSYEEWEKRGADPDHPRTMRVDYHCGINQIVSEWVCVEHGGFARNKAEDWWMERSIYKNDVPPHSAREAADLARGYRSADGATIEEGPRLKAPTFIKVKITAGSRYPDIEDYEFDDFEQKDIGNQQTRFVSPQGLSDHEETGAWISDEEIPF